MLFEKNTSAAEEVKIMTDSLLCTKSMMKQELEQVSEVSQAIDSNGQILATQAKIRQNCANEEDTDAHNRHTDPE